MWIRSGIREARESPAAAVRYRNVHDASEDALVERLPGSDVVAINDAGRHHVGRHLWRRRAGHRYLRSPPASQSHADHPGRKLSIETEEESRCCWRGHPQPASDVSAAQRRSRRCTWWALTGPGQFRAARKTTQLGRGSVLVSFRDQFLLSRVTARNELTPMSPEWTPL